MRQSLTEPYDPVRAVDITTNPKSKAFWMYYRVLLPRPLPFYRRTP